MANLNRRNGRVGLKNGKPSLEEVIGVEPTQSEAVLPLAPPRPEYPVGDYGVLASKEKPSWRNWSKWKKRIVAASLPFIFLGGIFAGANIYFFTRGFTHVKLPRYHEIIIRDPRYGFNLKPGTPEGSPEINEQAYREEGKIPLPKPNDQFRIAGLGDSVMFGHSVKSSESLPSALERTIEREVKDCEVVNFGVPGACPPQYILHWRYDREMLNSSDLIMVNLSPNDPVDCYKFGRKKSSVRNIGPIEGIRDSLTGQDLYIRSDNMRISSVLQ